MRNRWVQHLLDWLGIAFVVLFALAVLLGIGLALGWDPTIGNNDSIIPQLLN